MERPASLKIGFDKSAIMCKRTLGQYLGLEGNCIIGNGNRGAGLKAVQGRGQ